MHLVPIIPQARVGVEDRLEVPAVASVKAAHPISERTEIPLPEHAVKHHAEHAIEHQGRVQQGEVRQERRLLLPPNDRRQACRRFHHLPILEELRSNMDRRHRTRRKTDLPTHIDVEV